MYYSIGYEPIKDRDVVKPNCHLCKTQALPRHGTRRRRVDELDVLGKDTRSVARRGGGFQDLRRRARTVDGPSPGASAQRVTLISNGPAQDPSPDFIGRGMR